MDDDQKGGLDIRNIIDLKVFDAIQSWKMISM